MGWTSSCGDFKWDTVPEDHFAIRTNGASPIRRGLATDYTILSAEFLTYYKQSVLAMHIYIIAHKFANGNQYTQK